MEGIVVQFRRGRHRIHEKHYLLDVGLGDREEAILRGRTEGFKYMKDKLGVTSESILSIETARKIAEEVDTLVAVGGESAFTDLMKIAVTTTGILNSKDKVPAEIETKEVDHE